MELLLVRHHEHNALAVIVLACAGYMKYIMRSAALRSALNTYASTVLAAPLITTATQ
jgi:hypothetical protein